LDGFNVLSDTVVAISAAPSKSVSGWIADQVCFNVFKLLE
jgi:hypothetical protein